MEGKRIQPGALDKLGLRVKRGVITLGIERIADFGYRASLVAVRVERHMGGYLILKGESMEVTAVVKGNCLELVSIEKYIPRNVLPDEGSVREWMAKYVRKGPWDCAFSGCRKKRVWGEGELVRMTIEPVKYYDGWDVSHLECYGKIVAGTGG